MKLSTYPFLNFNGETVEVTVWISNFISHFTRHVYDYLSMLGLKLNHVSIRGHWWRVIMGIKPRECFFLQFETLDIKRSRYDSNVQGSFCECAHASSKRLRYIVTSPLIGWVHTQNNPCCSNVWISTGSFPITDTSLQHLWDHSGTPLRHDITSWSRNTWTQ